MQQGRYITLSKMEELWTDYKIPVTDDFDVNAENAVDNCIDFLIMADNEQVYLDEEHVTERNWTITESDTTNTIK